MKNLKPLAIASLFFLTGCLETIPGLSAGNKPTTKTEASSSTQTSANAAGENNPTSQSAPKPASAETAFSKDEAVLDIVKGDGKSCASTSERDFGGNLAGMAQLTTGLAATFALAQINNGGFKQSSLDELKPQLKEISKYVLWLPVATEKIIGDYYLKQSTYTEIEPKSPREKSTYNAIKSEFDFISAYAVREKKSPLDFKLRLIEDANNRSFGMLPGGTLVVPSGALALLAQERNETNRQNIIKFMVAHEMSHALKRHQTKQLQASIIDAILVTDRVNTLLKAPGKFAVNDFGSMLNITAENVRTLIGGVCSIGILQNLNEKQQELEADVCGAKVLYEAPVSAGFKPFDAVAGLDAYTKLMLKVPTKVKKKPDSANISFESCFGASNHPAFADRRTNMLAYADVLRKKYLVGK